MLLRSGARALTASSTAEAERHLLGDFSLLWTFLQGEGWCFATNSWDVCPPLMDKEPYVLGEGFGSRAFPQARVREWPASTSSTTELRIEVRRTGIMEAWTRTCSSTQKYAVRRTKVIHLYHKSPTACRSPVVYFPAIFRVSRVQAAILYLRLTQLITLAFAVWPKILLCGAFV